MQLKNSEKSAGNWNVTSSDVKKSSNGQSGLPAISLPKGGGAIRGIGEKFAANPVTGTGSLTVPIFTSPGRSGFGPTLSLSYDSGSGNGPFGFGWNLSIPSITRKTSKGIPKYQDADESDVFILSGAEDLVPVFKKDENGEFEKDGDGNFVIDEGDRDGYTVRKYRPRTEGLFARIERWTDSTNGDVHWRSISKDNILIVYGKTSESRIADPADESARRIFSWLISQSYDDKGNAILYEYTKEDEKGIDNYLLNTNERNRIRTANRYIKRIFYGNRKPLLIDPTKDSFRRSHLEISDNELSAADWLFQVVFDYDEDHYNEIPFNTNIPEDQHQLVEASASAGGIWSARPDPFSAFRSSFEIRTYRRCHRVLMFHQFPELGDEPYLVRSTEFDYSDFNYSAAATFTISDELIHKGSTRIASFIQKVTQSGYVKDETRPIHNVNGAKYLTYIKKPIPPLEFEYNKCVINHEIKDLDETTLENLPTGLDDSGYRFVDLDGEGVSGILTEQADTWYYKPNLGGGKFGPIKIVGAKPSIADLNSGRQQLIDLAGDGQLDLLETTGPISGFYERNHDSNWENFVPFQSIPNVAWNDPNLRLVDLTGDGHADILVTENEVLTWYQSLAEKGFEPSRRVIQELDEEKGPRLVLSEGSESIYLADMSGDGLSDLVRITNGEVCYWPNLGYGKFGSKVTMDNCPWFDSPDQFDNRNIRLADIDGSGVTDIIYVGGSENKGLKIYFNQSGNRWSNVYYLDSGLQIDDNTSIQVADLLGNGTACLVWSSSLPGNSRNPMRYLDLMGGVKPHLLIKSVNNLGAETQVEYAPSTKFYLADKAAGKPWITRLPFPVHVVERVITYDYIGRNLFVTKCAYHHGYFDGIEKEFRGFGMVEQWDTEEFATLSNSDNLPILNATNIEEATHVPPVYTKTWFHTGVYLGREHVSDFFGGLIDIHDRGEYYREPEWRDDDIEARKHLLDDTILPGDLTIDEEHEACRALGGSMLRQEVYSRDGTEKEGQPYTVTERNFAIQLLQPRGKNQSAIFFIHPREVINYHYERKLFPVLSGQVIDERTVSVDPTNPDIKWVADPRVQHAVTLDVDSYGNVLKSASIAYGRRLEVPDPALLPEDHEKQRLIHITCMENTFTNPVIDKQDAYRTPLPAETSTYELRKRTQERSEPGVVTKLYKFEELRNHVNRSEHGRDIDYEDIDFTQANNPDDYFSRLIEQVRILYRPDALGAAENDLLKLLELGKVEPLALTGETYKLAFTPGLLAQVYKRDGQALLPPNTAEVLGRGDGVDKGGYIQSQQFKVRGIFPNTDPDDYWWLPSGRVFLSPDTNDTATEELEYAEGHFFLPLRFRDPFHTDQVSTESFLTLDTYDLLMLESRDAVDNLVTVGRRLPNGEINPANDYRVLQPMLITDSNGNRKQAVFDALGMVAGTAVMGQNEYEGDDLNDFKADLTQAEIKGFYDSFDPHEPAADLLKGATTRVIYDLNKFHETQGEHPNEPAKWLPTYAATLARETHVRNPVSTTDEPKIQISFSYSDGLGREIQKKIQAEPEPGTPAVIPRWVGSGWIVLNNKGKPVLHYEPFFSLLPPKSRHHFEFGRQVGVSSVLFYDPVERIVATLHPSNTFEKVVFDPWRQDIYDVNDTVAPHDKMQTGDPRTDPDIHGYVEKYFATLDNSAAWKTWFEQRQRGDKGPEEQAAAEKAAAHASTPTTIYLDSLGRPFLTLTRNRFERNTVIVDELYATRVELDIEGNQREVRDAKIQNGDLRGRIVMQYDYDMLGNRIHQLSMEAGARWILNDVIGKPIRAWDSRGHNFRTEYDPLRRTIRSFVTGADPFDPNKELLTERLVYGEQHPENEPLNNNLRGKLCLHLDQAGSVNNEKYDFKGNLLRSSRRLTKQYRDTIDWRSVDDEALPNSAKEKFDLDELELALEEMLEDEKFTNGNNYDALDRPIQIIFPHSNRAGTKINVTQPIYNQANLLECVDAWLELDSEPDVLLDPLTATDHFVGNIDYNAKGQRMLIEYGNGVRTTFEYDQNTFRLTHMQTVRAVDEKLQDLFYFHDPIGNIVSVHDVARQAIFFNGQVVKPDADYAYDASYRLIKATGREHEGQAWQPFTAWNDESRIGLAHPHDGQKMRNYLDVYDYDEVGNMLTLHHKVPDTNNGSVWIGSWIRRYDYQEMSLIEQDKRSNRLSRTVVHPNAQQPIVETFTYDVHGNTTSMPHLENMESNFNDHLKKLDLGGGGRVYHVYDSSGQRVRKVHEHIGALVEERIYLETLEIYRRHNSSGLKLEREGLHIMEDRQRIALVETRTLDLGGNDIAPRQLIRYQIDNHLGSISIEVDKQGRIISYEEYTPYGGTSFQSGQILAEVKLKRYRYTGMERDEESGLNYHEARYYATWLGRWVSCDPSGVVGGLNLYIYAHSNPIGFVDPTGTDDVVAWYRTPQQIAQIESQVRYLSAQMAQENDPIVHGMLSHQIMELQGILSVNERFGERIWKEEHNWLDNWYTSKDEQLEYWRKKELHKEWELLPNILMEMTGMIVRSTPEVSGKLFILFSSGLGTAPLSTSQGGMSTGSSGGGATQGWEQFRAKAAEIQRESAAKHGAPPNMVMQAQSGSGKVGPANLRSAGLEGVDLFKASYNAGRKQLEKAGFVLSETTSTGRKVFLNPITGARVMYDGTPKSLGAGQKPHWEIFHGNQYLRRDGRPVSGPNPVMGGKHIPGR